jgi:GNAT superfamily N-acetyltransferase
MDDTGAVSPPRKGQLTPNLTSPQVQSLQVPSPARIAGFESTSSPCNITDITRSPVPRPSLVPSTLSLCSQISDEEYQIYSSVLTRGMRFVVYIRGHQQIVADSYGISLGGVPGDHMVDIDKYNIKSAYRRKGHGREIMSRLVQWYGHMGTRGFRVSSPSSTGIPFYRKIGFVREDTLDLVFWFPSRSVPDPSPAAEPNPEPRPELNPEPSPPPGRGPTRPRFTPALDTPPPRGQDAFSDERSLRQQQVKSPVVFPGFDLSSPPSNIQSSSAPLKQIPRRPIRPPVRKAKSILSGDDTGDSDEETAEIRADPVKKFSRHPTWSRTPVRKAKSTLSVRESLIDLDSDYEVSDSPPELLTCSDSDESDYASDSSSEEAVDGAVDSTQQQPACEQKKPVRALSSINLKRGQRNMVAMDQERWSITEHEKDGEKLSLRHKHSGVVYVVAASRVNKAARFLDPEEAATMLCKNCCSRGCSALFTRKEIIEERVSYFTGTSTEHEASEYILRLLRHDKGELMIQKKMVCRTVFCSVFGISKGKLTGIRKAYNLGAQGKLATSVQGTDPIAQVDNEKMTTRAVAFWADFFSLCQRPRPGLRLFPVNKSLEEIYSEYFTPWHSKHHQSDPLPSLSTFTKARKKPQFSDVKKRSKHFHCRCNTCARLQAWRLRAFKDGEDQREFKIEREIHHLAVWAWRDLEKYWQGVAISSPHTTAMLSFDDTSKVGLPLFTKRTYKGLPASRQFWVPFLIYDHGLGSRDYMYTYNNRFKKGANRYCTLLYAAIRRIKSNPSHPSHKARRLVLCADNYVENKNSTNFKFWAHMITCGWFDEVLLLFGPVGHTHFWIDQMHGVHNRELCNHTAGDLGHLLSFFPNTWTDPSKRPTPSVMDAQFDWDKYYKPCGDDIAGFTKTKGNPHVAGAFRIKRTNRGTVEMTFKRDAVDRHWLGKDGVAGTPGFIVLNSLPTGKPVEIAPTEFSLPMEYLKQLKRTSLKEAMDAEGLSVCRTPLLQAAVHGVLAAEIISPKIAQGDWGYRARIGALVQSEIQLIGATIFKKAWNGIANVFSESRSVPASGIAMQVLEEPVLPVLPEHTLTDEMLQNRALPYIGFNNERVKRRETYNNPVMVDHRAEMMNSAAPQDEDQEIDVADIVEDADSTFPYPDPELEEYKDDESQAQDVAGACGSGAGGGGGPAGGGDGSSGPGSGGGGGAGSSSSVDGGGLGAGGGGGAGRSGAGRNKANSNLRVGRPTKVRLQNHDVIATVGEKDNGDYELWFFVPSKTSRKTKKDGSMSIQYLTECDGRPGHYQVDGIVDTTAADTEELHRWKGLSFESKRVQGVHIVTTHLPLDEKMVQKMQEEVDKRNVERKKKQRDSYLCDSSESSDTTGDDEESLISMGARLRRKRQEKH